MCKLTHQEYVLQVEELHGEKIEIRSQYIGSTKPITYKCKVCNEDSTIQNASDLVRNRNRKHPCRACYWRNMHEERRQQAKMKILDKIKNFSDITVVSDFRDKKENRLFLNLLCTTCSHKWTAASNNIGRSSWKGCPSCWIESEELKAGKHKGILKSRKKVMDEAREKFFTYLKEHTNFQLLDDYNDMHGPLKFRCGTCKNTWRTSPGHIVNSKSGCPSCKSGHYEAKLNYKVDVAKVHGRNIIVLEEYISSTEKILHKCTNCDNEWSASPQSIKRGSGCPSCNHSRGESRIQDFLKRCNIPFIPQWKEHECKFYNKLSFDFYLPTYNIAIEFQGIQHEKFIPYFHKTEQNFETQKKRDSIKKSYCKKHNISLLEIWHYDFDNIHNILEKTISIHTKQGIPA